MAKNTGKTTVKWYGAQVKKNIRKAMRKRLMVVGAMMEAEIKKLISIRMTRVVGPSKPGDPPHRDLGRLSQSIFHKMQGRNSKGQFTKGAGLAVIVGTPLKYGLFLEIGTSKMDKRPYLRPTLLKNRMKIERILTAKIDGIGVKGRLITRT